MVVYNMGTETDNRISLLIPLNRVLYEMVTELFGY
jgi:hypothetical protein